MFKLVHNNKHGFSLVELLVTLIIIGLVLPLAAQMMNQFSSYFQMASLRYDIQEAVKLACNKLETQRDTIVNAYEADVLYDPYVAGGIIVTNESPFTFEWRKMEVPVDEEFDRTKEYGENAELGGPYTVPAEGSVDSTDLFTYIFSTPAFNKNGDYLGTYLFVREYGSANSTLFLDSEGFGTVPINVKFSFIEAGGGLFDSGENAGQPNPALENKDGSYLEQAIHLDLTSGLEDVTNYTVGTEFALVNTKRDINTSKSGSEKIMLEEWVNRVDNKKNAGPAGWVKGYPKAGGTTQSFRLVYNYDEVDGNGATVTKTGETDVYTLTQYGNVLRFISPAAYHDKGEISEGISGAVELASCLGDWTFSDMNNANFYLDKFRYFRDDVLKGTEFGDWFIDCYYHKWSPFLIEHTAFLKPVYKAILIPLSYVCEFVARL